MTQKAYAGVGPRENVPADVLDLMYRAGAALAAAGFLLRSGGAKNSDTQFERGALSVGGATEIFLPEAEFRGHASPLIVTRMPRYRDAQALASWHHPNWAACDRFTRDCMARNCMQVLGADLTDPVKFVILWGPKPEFADGQVVNVAGGTGQAVRLARTFKVPVFHLGVPEHAARIQKYIDAYEARSQP